MQPGYSDSEGCRLPAGKYWLSVVPYCTNKNDSNCTYWRMFLMNDDGVMAHRYGPLEPANNSFFNSAFLGRTGTLFENFSPVSASASAWKEQLHVRKSAANRTILTFR